MNTSFITRGILIGGSLGAFAALFGINGNANSMFIPVGVGVIAGFFAGITRSYLAKKKR